MFSIRMIFFGFLMFQNTFSQKPVNPGNFYPPLDIPLFLSGNFGELRADHFHSGVDFKTQGVTGKKVYSVDEGYVSRIKIQTQGYGNSIYITHPGGITSVYGHLERYSDSIANYVRAYQYQNKTHTLDIYPDKNFIKVKKGEIIAYSGNTGSSGGPHLHFELRGTSSQHPLNVLLYGFNVKDNIPPQLFGLYVYPRDEKQTGKQTEPKVLSLKKTNGSYRLSSGDTITLRGNVGFGLETSDFLNDVSNSCGVYSIEVFVNDVAVYLFRMDEFSFDESTYINAHADYRAMVEKNKKIHLLYRKPNNRLSLYPLIINDGIIDFKAGEISKLEIRVNDAYGNTSILNYYVKGSAPSGILQKTDTSVFQLFKWSTPNYYENAQIRLILPVNSLYEDYIFNYARTDAGVQKLYPYTHYIGDSFTPLHKAAVLSISGDLIPERLQSKAVIARLENSNKITCLSSSWKGNTISASISKFGRYTLVADTIAPVILPLNIKSGANISTQSSIRFKVTDDLSGISSYQGFIDNAWVLFEYDPKNEVVECIIDSKRLSSGKEHELELYIKDAVGNQKIYHSKFIW